jgi:hypothetical protein
MRTRTEALAQRIEQAHQELIDLIAACSDRDWETYIPDEGRTVGLVIHHVGSVLPDEVDLVRALAAGKPITGVTPAGVDAMNAQHAEEHVACTRDETLELLRRNSAAAIAAIQSLDDEQLDQAATVSLHWNAPLTAQYFIEEHPLLHTYHHLVSIRAVLGSESPS